MDAIEAAVHAKLSEVARAEPLGVMALALARRLDADPGDDVATRLNRELRLTMAAVAGPDTADDVQALLDRIAAPGLGPVTN
jgi:hypothetical protein